MKKTLVSASARIATILAASLLAGFTAGCHHDPNVQKQKYLESGKRYAKEGKYKEATIQFSNALRVDHNFADAHYQLALTYLRMGSAMPAYAELSRAVALRPDNLQARIDLGNLLLAGKQPDRAAEQANAVLAIKNDNADAYALLSSIAATKGDRATALEQIQHALSIDPNRSSFHTALGLIQGSDPTASASAEEQLRKAASLDATNVTARLALASLLERKGDLPGALEQQKAAVAAAPKDISARASLAQLYLRQGDKVNAEQILRQTAEELPDDSAAAQLLQSYYVQTGQLDRAETVYAELAQKHPKSVPIRLAYARILLGKKDVPKAKSVVADLMKTDGGDSDVAVLNGILLLNEGKTNDAFEALQKAAKNNPQSVPVKIWLGRAALVKGDMSVAQQSFTDASRLSPANLEAESGIAQVAMQKHDDGLLSQVADTVVSAHPEMAVGYVWRGMAEGAQQPDKAESDFKQAIRIDPKNPGSYLELAQLKLSQKHIPEAVPLLEQALAYDPNSSHALALLASVDLYQKQPQKALARVQQQIAKVPQNGPMYTQLAQLQMQTGDINGALASADKAMQLNPSDSGAVMMYTQAQLAHGDPQKAIDSWQQWIKDHPSDARANAIVGTLEQARGDNDKATGFYKKALQIEPDQPIAANNLAYIMLESGQNVDMALSYAQSAHRSMPDSASTADTLAWAYYYKGTYESARDLLEDALKTAPEDPSIHYHLGMTYAKLSDKDDATTHLKKAAALAPNSQTAKDAEKALQQLS